MVFSYYIFLLFIVLISLFFVSTNFLNILIVVENFNVLLLVFCLLLQLDESMVVFMSLLVIMTLEVSFGLVIVSKIWCVNELKFMVSL